MIIPENGPDLSQFLQFVITACMASQQRRQTLYEKRRRFFLYGQNMDIKTRFNRLKSHLKLVSSFLYSPEGLIYNITAPKNADEQQIMMYKALQDDWNQDVQDSGLADDFSEAVLWALNFDTMILKPGWNDLTGQLFSELIEPSSFGVFREDKKDFANQPAMNHQYLLDYDDAAQRLYQAGRAEDISKLAIEGAQALGSGLPAPLMGLIITATGGENLMGNVQGSVNPGYEESTKFQPTVMGPTVRLNETWIWDTPAKDWRIFHSLGGGVILSDSKKTINMIKSKGTHLTKYDSETNWYLKGENPFVPVTPYKLYNLFWGDCHQEDIIPLQKWSNERLEQIDEILKRQEDPAKVFTGFQGITDEVAGALGGPGTWVSEPMPGAGVNELKPTMPEDLFREFNEIGSLMMEASGLTEVTSGRSSGGARGGQQQRQMQITGGGNIRKTAIGLEGALVRLGELGLKLKMKNDDEHIKSSGGAEFVAAQLSGKYSMMVDGHSHSPLFTLETKELAQMLFKAQAIDREWFIRMLNPPARENLLHSLRLREQAEAKLKAQEAAAGATEHKKK